MKELNTTTKCDAFRYTAHNRKPIPAMTNNLPFKK
jgi:hypothetical protein